MKKTGLLLTFLVISIIGYSQKRVNVPGTKVWLILPKEATLANNFTGFWLSKEKQAGGNVLDLANKSFDTNTKNFTKEFFEKDGMKVLKLKQLKIDGYSAKFAHLLGTSGSNKYYLFFGNSTILVKIMTSYPSPDRATGDQLKKIVLSATYKKDQKTNPFVKAYFQLDDSKSRLKFSRYIPNGMYYYMLGENSEQKNKRLFLMASPVPKNEESTIKNSAIKVLFGLKSIGFTSIKMISNEEIKVNNYQAYTLNGLKNYKLKSLKFERK